MPTETPLGPDAKIILIREQEIGNPDEIHLHDGNGDAREIAWQAPDSTKEDFEWLASAAAAFHKIPLEIHQRED
jgi:hypothetical protein